MDLFGDLPEPANSNPEKQSEQITEASLQNDKILSNHDDKRGVKRKDYDTEDEVRLILKGFHAERKGEREEMQDAHVIIDSVNTPSKVDPSIKNLSFYAIYDGHAGTRASKYAAANLHQNILNKFPKGDVSIVEKEIKKCITESFLKTDDDFLKEALKSKPTWKDGTTATLILVINNTLYIAGIGDSKAILCRHNNESEKYSALPLTRDHTPSVYEERMRIQKAGGHVREGRVLGILEVSRSIGDGQFKRCGVIALPEVRRCQLAKTDKFIVIACDGLWKVFSHDEVIEIVINTLNDTSIPGNDDSRYEMACTKLTAEAVRKLSGDNVTVVIVKIFS